MELTLDELHQTTHDEYWLKAAGLLSALENFSLFGLKLGCLIFGASETLSKPLQGKDSTHQEALAAINLAKIFYRRQRTDEAFHHFHDVYWTPLWRWKLVVHNYLAIGEGLWDMMMELIHIGMTLQGSTIATNILRLMIFFFGNWKIDLSNVNCCHLLYLQSSVESYKSRNVWRRSSNAKGSCWKDTNFSHLKNRLHLLVDLIKQALPCVKRVNQCALYAKQWIHKLPTNQCCMMKYTVF